jgi:hypothetical protein
MDELEAVEADQSLELLQSDGTNANAIFIAIGFVRAIRYARGLVFEKIDYYKQQSKEQNGERDKQQRGEQSRSGES